MNIISFLNSYSIDYVDSGSNVKHGNINVVCPFCKDDPSEHMGIAIKVPHVYGCWRNSDHRGIKIENLIVALLDCSWVEAKRIVEKDSFLLDKEGTLSKINSIFQSDSFVDTHEVQKVELLSEFKELSSNNIYKRFYMYFNCRGYTDRAIDKLKNYYNLKCTYSGDYAWRIIIPIYYQQKLVTWTSRTIRQNDTLRYKNLSFENSIMRSTDCLYDFDRLIKQEGEKLFLVEGPFDCYPLFLYSDIAKVTCTFTLTISDNQKYLLSLLSKNYDEIIILPDRGFEVQARKLKNELSFIRGVRIQELPVGFNDPGELNKDSVKGCLL